MPTLVSDILAWGVVALFLLGPAIKIYADRDTLARSLTGCAWGIFGVFWLVLVPHFAFEQRSFVEGALAILAVPACIYTGYLLYTGRESLFILTRAVAIMGLIYLPVQTMPVVHQTLIEATTVHTEWVMSLFGYTPTVEVGNGGFEGYRNSFVFPVEGVDHIIRFSIILACTGLGTIAIFTGLVLASPAPLWRRLRALLILVPVLYALNIVRTTFIAIMYGYQKAHIMPDVIMSLFGLSDPYLVSYFLADRVLAQVFALVAVVVLGIITVKLVPSLVVIAEDALYVLTRTEYDLESLLDESE